MLKLLTTWLYSNITPFSRVIVPVVLSSLAKSYISESSREESQSQ